MIDLFGPVPVRANLSARQAKELGLLTSGTYGQPSTTSSKSVALQSSLESRLRERLNGSHLCTVTWVRWDTPWGQCLSKPRALAQKASESGFSLWPTPAVMDQITPRSDEQLARAKSLAGCHNLKDVLPKPSDAEMERRVRVNPALSRGLMDLPQCWDDCAPTAMPSTPK
ncbi:hypothetical protein N8I74_10845 [Chitiniphilus purpureus]|uniref:Uncharacterized protein n=1 Tax=Chitiniphilus purpureus TaxID=2981137 RepID=A0ABY6DHK1_9NEIS|nr:hypothetical protein [Chitiniphilus sp. CD1]UXY13819.1 hypothetical protein N8I74_10845 [Chitiniphilus sp. CD1]